MRKKYLLVVVIAGALGALGFAAANLSPSSKISGVLAQQTHADKQFVQTENSIEGLAQEDQVSYRVFADGVPVFSEQKTVGDGGRLDLPLWEKAIPREATHVVYDLNMLREGAPVSLTFRVDRTQNRMGVSGRGVGGFAPVTIESAADKIETKSDWTGSFELPGISTGTNSSGSFRVALFGNDVLGDIQGANPLLVHIDTGLETEGGGGVTNSNVNKWSKPSKCGDPELSICDESDVNKQIRTVVSNYVMSLISMTQQLSAVMMQYVQIVGSFMDAKQLMETQRQIQIMQAQAHKDYHPSEQMCRIGTFVRSIHIVEAKSRYDAMAINQTLIDRYTNTAEASSGQGADMDIKNRLKNFREIYCDPADHGGEIKYLCQHDPSDPRILQTEGVGGSDSDRFNSDIDFMRTVNYPLTLDVDFTDGKDSTVEHDVIALARNLYWPEIMSVIRDDHMAQKSHTYREARRIMAMHNVAHNSYAQIIGMKSKNQHTTSESGPSFMKALMREFGLQDTEIEEILGENPSYYAQMEVLTKKMYQSPDFYTDLYDKPMNVARIGASLDAIRIMQMRDSYESALRREMLASMLLEANLSRQTEAMNEQIATDTAR